MKKSRNYFKILELSLAVGVAFTLIWGAVSLGRQEELAEKVVRLHVLANSDSDSDQALKLRVRDSIIGYAESILRASHDRGDAEQRLRTALPELERLAADAIEENGYDYSVTAELQDTRFPTREYDGFTLPAGDYLALRVVIGEGAGHNWWCVVFPPLCAEATEDLSRTAMAAGLSEDDVGLITEEDQGYVLKFKSIELWESLKEKIGK